MTEEALTFSELRKIQKKEKRQEELSKLDDNFFLRVSQYLDMKESTDKREYRNAKRVFDKIIGLRQEKIVKNAKISVKAEVKASELNLLPRESEFFRNIKETFEQYDEEVTEMVESSPDPEDIELPEEDLEDEEEEEEEDPTSYTKVEVLSDIPEFMGTDLESYGPLEEGEEKQIPEENAEILENRGQVEVVE